MRLNKYLALHTGLSRRAADTAIAARRVTVNGQQPSTGQDIQEQDTVALDGKPVQANTTFQTIMLHKPVGYVCSRDGQGSQTVYDLLPPALQGLKTVGRLDKDSSGLLLLTNDGQLAYQLTHPKFEKTKVYKIALNKPLSPQHLQQITTTGVALEDGVSKLTLEQINPSDYQNWKVTMHEGRNRQIRRTFEQVGYSLPKLHRIRFGDYRLGDLARGAYKLCI